MKKITIYTTRFCGYCNAAKKWLEAEGEREFTPGATRWPRANSPLVVMTKLEMGGALEECRGPVQLGWDRKTVSNINQKRYTDTDPALFDIFTRKILSSPVLTSMTNGER